MPEYRPRMHFQIDLLVLGASVSSKFESEIRPFCHPGGAIFRDTKLLGRFTPEPTWDVGFAKLRPDEKKFLFNEVAKLPAGSVYVEVGTYRGGSAVLAALANPKIRIYAVDIWAGQNPDFEVFQRHTQYFPNIVPIRVPLERIESGPELIAAKENVKLTDLKIDFLFVDGDHSYNAVLKDLRIYDRYSKFVCGHDFSYGSDVHAAALNYYNGWSNAFPRNDVRVRIQRPILRIGKILTQRIVRAPGDSTIWMRR